MAEELPYFKPDPLSYIPLTHEHILNKIKEASAAIESHHQAITDAQNRALLDNKNISQMNRNIPYGVAKRSGAILKNSIAFHTDKIKALEERINNLRAHAMKKFPSEATASLPASATPASATTATATATTATAAPITLHTNSVNTSIHSDLEDENQDPHVAISMANINNYGEKLPEDCKGGTCNIMGGRRRVRSKAKAKARSTRRYKKKTSRSRKYRRSNKK